MLAVIGYALAFATAVSVAALGLEHIAVRNRRPRRRVWALTMLLSILLPAALLLQATATPAPPQLPPAAVVVTVSPQPATAADQSIEPVAPGIASPVDMASAPPLVASQDWHLPQVDARWLLLAWAAASGVLLAFLATISLLLHRRAATWVRESLLGQDVWVSEETGPALIGVLRPQVVVPR